MTVLSKTLLSEAQYLEDERTSLYRREYLAGLVFAKSGASKSHATIAGNIAVALRLHLRGRPCQGFVADMKVRLAAANAYYYPDVVATCDERDLSATSPTDFLRHPCLVVEVLSPGTEQVDRREKWLNYRALPSLQEYLLVDQDRCWVELYRRTATGWQQEVASELTEVLDLQSVGLALALSVVYEDIQWEVPADAA
jgi:Uma2 family endonuclease